MIMDLGIRHLKSSDALQFGDNTQIPYAVDLGSYQFDGFDHSAIGGFRYENGNGVTFGPVIDDPAVDNDLEFSEIFSDINLGYITKIIMAENVEDMGYMHQGDSSLFCAEMDGSANALSSGMMDPLVCPENSSDDSGGTALNSCDSGGGSGLEGRERIDKPPVFPGISSGDPDRVGGNLSDYGGGDQDWVSKLLESPQVARPLVDRSPQSSFSSPSSNTNSTLDSIDESQLNSAGFPDLFLENHPLWQCHFKKGMEEANKFLPEIDKLMINLGSDGASGGTRNIKAKHDEVGKEKRVPESRGRKQSNHEYLDLEEGRSVKQSAVYEEGVRSEMFDEVLLTKNGTCTDTISALIEKLKKEANQRTRRSDSRSSSGGKSRGRKQGKKDVVDLTTLLIHCAQSVAADDRRNANELLKQIRQHCNASGDAIQKLALIFANGLEARLAGTGSQVYYSLMAKQQSAVDILKAYRLYIAACPFKRISQFFANQTILNLAKKASTLHIIDYGINFGFQWPCLIQQLSMIRPGKPPNLRITGIDVPQPGFRPRERVEETGRRLADYCRTFNVPFKFNAIVSKLEDVHIEDLKIKQDEVLVVNCLYRFRNLADESVFVDSPRDIVLNNIRKMNPDVFIHGVINGSYSAPFFVTRFREALFFYSSLFDMIETTIPRDHPEKLLIENEIFGREAINVVACEGSEREERPETYRQWQVRSLRAGFKQLPLNPDILRAAKDKVRSSYHKDFIIDEDGRWLLQGWKGRTIYALSTWIPTAKGF